MRYPGEHEVNQIQGIGYPGEVAVGPDNNLYQWVEGIDGLGNPVGSWRIVRRLARTAAPFIPGGAAVQAGLRLRRLARRRRRPAIRQAAAAATGTAGWGLGEDELMQVLGIGSLGELAIAPDGNVYQWVEGIDGLGNPFGFWKKWRKRLRRLTRRVLPLAQQVAPFIPGGAAALRVATPILRKAGVAGHNGLGALYQAPDGTLYQVQGLTQDDEFQGAFEDDDIEGLAQDEELYGVGEDEEFEGYGGDEELYGLAEDEELYGLAEDEYLDGLEGYIREDGVSGLGAYLKDEPPNTRMFAQPSQTPEVWRPLW